ncbi:hypothetical protein [Streptomyces sp. SID10815]|uniref:hypothetical protein n=1 Tax=Streptomyces sp. SID10815 TaxID=2706027 RepID=UPI0013CAC1E9|nr:hypothetical protein [Streptomyces sp. SID10815]NEA51172.1 hypothetical protein [Streptomyces sp. SID10815]
MNGFRLAPWWIYAVAIGGLNIVRQVLFPPSQVGTAVTVGLFFAVLAVGFAAVTILHALTVPRGHE